MQVYKQTHFLFFSFFRNLGYETPQGHLTKWEVNQYIMIGWKTAVATVI